MTRSTDQNGVTSTSGTGRWRVVMVVRICALLLGVVLAGLAPAAATGGPSEPMLVSDAEIVLGHVDDELLATGVAERTTPEQVASREKGYLKANALSAIQTAAVRQIAQRHGLLDAQGQVTEDGASLCVGIWHTWQAYVSIAGDGTVTWHKLDFGLRPPTVEAVLYPPLASSLLRSSWPYPAPSAGLTGALRSLQTMAEQGSEPDGVGWHLRDLPLLYRNWIQDEWQRTVELESKPQSPVLDVSTTDVLWANTILVSVMLQQEDGSGGGVEFVVPAF